MSWRCAASPAGSDGDRLVSPILVASNDTRCNVPRYSAKLLFIWNPDPVTESRRQRLCEERIVVFQSRSPADAVRKAKAIGRAEQVRFDDGHQLRFAGMLQCMDLESLDSSEVWWEYQRRSNPEQWARKAIPPESDLYVFTDRTSKMITTANKTMPPTRRPRRVRRQTTRRSRKARG